MSQGQRKSRSTKSMRKGILIEKMIHRHDELNPVTIPRSVRVSGYGQ